MADMTSGGSDKFVDMVSAKAVVALPLSSFQPRSSLKTAEHLEERPRFPVIDYHNHLDSVAAGDLLRIMDACEVELLVNITMQTGEAALAQMDRLRSADRARFATIGWMDWNGVERNDWGFSTSPVSKRELLEQRNRVIARHPDTQFVGAHLAESGEDLGALSRLLDTHANLQIDISARTPELGRQPYSARAFFLQYADRIVFGTDLLPDVAMYRGYYRFLQPADEYFSYPTHASGQGRWNIYGIFLPDSVLQKVYRENALRLLAPFR